MTIRDLLVHTDQTQATQVRLEAALTLAERFDAHVTALYLAAEPFRQRKRRLQTHLRRLGLVGMDQEVPDRHRLLLP